MSETKKEALIAMKPSRKSLLQLDRCGAELPVWEGELGGTGCI